MKSGAGVGVQVIARAGAVLRSLEHAPEGLSLAEIAARVLLPRSTVQRIVAALGDEQLLMPASPNARVKLGPALIRLAAAANAGTERLVRPLMQELSRLVEETVDLSVLHGGSAMLIEQVQGTQRLVAVSAVGKEFPLHCTANGKALLALLPPERRDLLLKGRLTRHTPATVTDRAALDAELREIESTELAFDLEEHSVGICAIAAAFRDPVGREYSLSIPVPSPRFAVNRLQLSRCLKKCLRELRQELDVQYAV
jgi:IclR family acetate operon transcriptional repressor